MASQRSFPAVGEFPGVSKVGTLVILSCIGNVEARTQMWKDLYKIVTKG